MLGVAVYHSVQLSILVLQNRFSVVGRKDGFVACEQQRHLSSFELVSSKRYRLACAHIEDSDQPAHLLTLIRVFNGQSIGSQGS